MAKKKRGVEESFILNQKSVNFYTEKLTLLAMNCFEWENLPEGIPERFIEKVLYNEGKVAFAIDKKYGDVCCKCNINGSLNMYDEAKSYNLLATNGYNNTFKADEVVIVRNNKDELPTSFFVDYYVKKLFEIDRTIDTNVIQQKTSRIVLCEESQKLSLENLLMQYEGNVPFIFGYKTFDKEMMNSLDLTAPYVADKLQELKVNIWRECLDTLGINNANTEKKERLITDEVNANNQLINLSSDIYLESRQIACDAMNEKFGWNVSVKRRGEEEKEDGEIYGGSGVIDTE